ncbi:PKD domain-containing protein [Patescibacteria group bacterium]|nr:PKD domain-containing protein [Patescibacteria group bacterium]
MAGDISQIIFAPESSQTAKPNEAALLTIQLQYAGDSHPTACMEMFTDSGTGQFSSSSSNWNNVDKLTINSNWASRKFYYKDSTVGAYTITIKVVSGVSCANLAGQEAQWTAEQNIIISDSNSTTVVESTAQQTQTTTVVVWPTEPQIFAEAGKDRNGVAGADIKFSGQSIGLNDKPLENARYLWTFGDGAKAEGKNVLHFYHYPGEYIVVLNVASGEYSASDRILVKISPNQLIISEANKDYIKLQNDSKNELDISGWFLGANGKFFRFPETTLIKANTDLLISSAISGLNIDNQKLSLFYPNGSAAYIYENFIGNNTEQMFLPAQQIKEVLKENTEIETVPEIIEEETNDFSNQTANVIVTTENDSLDKKKWIMMIGGVIIFAVTGLFIIRRQGAV